MRVGFYQFEVKFGEIDDNLAKMQHALSDAQADLIVLPELFATGYVFLSKGELEALAEPYPNGRTVQALAKVAKDRRMTLVAGFPEKADGMLYNSAAVVTPDGPAACYRKIHLYKEEKLLFTPGDTPFPVVDIGMAKIGVMICFDWFFPESARTLALKGAQIICHPANLVMPYCPDSMPVRALENRVFTITASRTGKDVRGEKEMCFVGQSEIVTPSAEILRRAPQAEEELFITEINPVDALEKNINEQNHVLRDRRPELYANT